MAEPNKTQFVDSDLQRAKVWWKEYGRALVGGAVIGLFAVVGFNYWQHREQTQAETASNLFEDLRDLVAIEAAAAADEEAEAAENEPAESEAAEAIESTADRLMTDYPSTPYATHAAFVLAKHFVESGQLGQAGQALEWILDNTEDSALQHIARLRLASVLLAREETDSAISLLQAQVNDTAGFTALYNELVGDAYLQNGDLVGARSAYQSSMEQLPQGSVGRFLIKLKLDGLGG